MADEDTPKSATTELSVLRRWGPVLMVAGSLLVWGVRLEGQQAALNEKNGALQTRVDSTEDQLATLRNDVTKFQGSVDTLKVMIDQVKDTTLRIERKLDDIQDKRAGK